MELVEVGSVNPTDPQTGIDGNLRERQGRAGKVEPSRLSIRWPVSWAAAGKLYRESSFFREVAGSTSVPIAVVGERAIRCLDDEPRVLDQNQEPYNENRRNNLDGQKFLRRA